MFKRVIRSYQNPKQALIIIGLEISANSPSQHENEHIRTIYQ